MPLQIQYSKQIARELGKIGVYFPGDEVNIGDIIKFPYGKKGLFRKEVPWGTFTRVTSLKNLEVSYTETGLSPDPRPYQFSTQNAVNMNFDVSGNASVGSPELPGVDAEAKITFNKEGALYFLAVGCQKNSIDDITVLEHQIQSKSDLLWDGTFLVTGVTVAQKAMVMQSKSSNSEVVIGGEVQGLQSGAAAISANAALGVKTKKGSLFIKDWSDNVTVFIEVMKLEKEVFASVTNKAIQEGIPSEAYDGIENDEVMDIDDYESIKPLELEEERLLLKKIDVSEYLTY